MLLSVCCLEIMGAPGYDLWGGCISGSQGSGFLDKARKVKVVHLVNFVFRFHSSSNTTTSNKRDQRRWCTAAIKFVESIERIAFPNTNPGN